MNVLLTSIGRRVEIVEYFKVALSGQGVVYAADADHTAPGLYFADKGFILPPVNDEHYLESLANLCNTYQVDLVIPFIDPELIVLAREAERLEKLTSAKILVSDRKVIDTCADKLLTASFFKEAGVPTAQTWLPEQHCWNNEAVIIKPRLGSAGKGVYPCSTAAEYEFYKRQEGVIVQELLCGNEVTLDALCDFKGRCLAVVPRKRLKIRAGEVERGVVIDAPELLQWTVKITEILGAVGPVNLQCFLTAKGPVFTEINARFGGGYPLAHQAGVNFPQMLVDLLAGRPVEPQVGVYERDLLMLRFDRAVIIPKKALIT